MKCLKSFGVEKNGGETKALKRGVYLVKDEL